MLFKKEIFNQTRGFLSYRLEDVEFSWRLLKKDFKLYYVPKGLVVHQGTRSPIQNIKKYLQYGKSYSKLSKLHQMELNNKSEKLVDNKSIWDYSKLILE